jgi:Uma2 family endonuclease
MATATAPGLELPELPIFELEKHYEVVDGRIVEESPLGAQEGSTASLLVESMGYFARSNRLGRVVTEVLFVIDPDRPLRRRPDVAFVSRERWPVNQRVPREAAWDVIPDLAVEITSPNDLIDDLMDKIEEYFVAGVRRVWVIYSKQCKVYIYESPTNVRILQLGDELDGGTIVPGFRIPLTQLFETEEGEPTPLA